MSLCYCKTEIGPKDRRILLSVTVEWGHDDERDTGTKGYEFCSFACVGQWTSDRSAAHDNHVVFSPPESHEASELVVDETTETLVR